MALGKQIDLHSNRDQANRGAHPREERALKRKMIARDRPLVLQLKRELHRRRVLRQIGRSGPVRRSPVRC